MSNDLPVLTTFGSILTFAVSLESIAQKLAEDLAAREDFRDHKTELVSSAEGHKKRLRKVEQLRRERLNEVVLQPVSGMTRETYIPPHIEVTTVRIREALGVVAATEEVVARFYDDAANNAADGLSGLDRQFRRMAEDSRVIAATFKALADKLMAV